MVAKEINGCYGNALVAMVTSYWRTNVVQWHNLSPGATTDLPQELVDRGDPLNMNNWPQT